MILTGPQVAGAQFIWAPDSSRILMYPDGGPSAYLVRPEGGDYTSIPGNRTISWIGSVSRCLTD